MQPEFVIDDGAGNIFFSDSHSHVVGFLNRGATPVNRLGMTIQPGQMRILTGNGAPGRNEENLGYTYTQNKLSTPRGLAYDSANDRLFIADSANHRVAQLDQTGSLTTVFGICPAASACSNTQSLAANTDGSAGTSHVCGTPIGLWLNSSNNNLYISCYGTYAVKRLNLADGTGHMVLGALTAGATTAAVNEGTLGTAGTARTQYPWDIQGDPNTGNLYLVEGVNGGNNRIRFINLSGGTVTPFNDSSGAATIYATDTSGSPLSTSAGLSVQQTASSNTAPSSLRIMGPTNMVNGNCYAMTAVVTDASGNLLNTNAAVGFNLGIGAGATGVLSAAAGCAGALTTLPGSIAIGANRFQFWFKPTSAYSAKTLTSSFASGAAGLTYPTFSHTSSATGVATNLAIFGPASIPNGNCQLYNVVSTNSSGVAANTAVARNIALDDAAPGTFYSDNTCSTLLLVTASGLPYVTLAAGTDSIAFFYRKPVPTSIAANSVGTIAGGANNATRNDALDRIQFTQSYALRPWFTGSTLNGIFVSAQGNSYVMYLNTLLTDVDLGGNKIRSFESGIVLGTNNASYNGEDVGKLTRVSSPRGLAIHSISNTELVFADQGNARVRTLDLSIANGRSNTIIGAGRLRSGFLTDTALPAPRVMMNSPVYLHFNSASNTILYSDSANSRIRSVDLTTGMVSTLIGTGLGDGSVENQDPFAVLMRSPTGVTVHNGHVLYQEQSTPDCIIRAYNSGVSNASIFNGLAILNAGTVSTIAGNISLGCQAWTAGTPNVNGTSALLNKLNSGEGIVSDGSSIYIAGYSDHCILKMDADGKLYQFLGACGTAGSADGLANTAVRLRYPTALVMDPDSANPGNFFIVDQIDQTSMIRYVNFKTSTVLISGVTVPAASNGSWAGGSVIPYIKTLYSGTGGNRQRWNGVAAFDKWICFSGGQGNTPNGDVGSHNITCRDRNNTNSIRFGLDETVNVVTTKGGAPLGSEQEGIDPAVFANNTARFYAPWGLAFDSSGNLYIAERGAHVIRMIKRWW
ncbi:MAG: hypothetical protein ACO3A2_10135 [Bdellovibrionia bacterium]